MFDLLKKIEQQHGSVTEYNRSMEEDKAHKDSACHNKKYVAGYSSEQKVSEQFDDDELPF